VGGPKDVPEATAVLRHGRMTCGVLYRQTDGLADCAALSATPDSETSEPRDSHFVRDEQAERDAALGRALRQALSNGFWNPANLRQQARAMRPAGWLEERELLHAIADALEAESK
jgi:hypothetical protein